MFVNITRVVWVTGRNSTNYTNTNMLSVIKPSTFLIIRALILKKRNVPSKPKSHQSIVWHWIHHILSVGS